MTTKERFEKLVSKRDALSSEKIQLETRGQMLKQEIQKTTEKLKEFGVSTLQEASQKVQEMESALSKEMAEIEEALSKFDSNDDIL